MAAARSEAGRVLRKRDALWRLAAVADLIHERPTAEAVSEAAHALAAKLPGAPAGVVAESLQDWVGSLLTEERVLASLWRLAANLECLRRCRPALSWVGGAAEEHVEVALTSFRPHRTKRDKLGGVFGFQVLTGAPAGEAAELFWSLAFCRLIAGRLGFGRPWEVEKRFEHGGQFVGCRLLAVVEAEHYEARPRLGKVAEAQPAALVSWNKRLAARRRRESNSGFGCPRRYPRTQACHRCPAGLDACPVATHVESHAWGRCRICGQARWVLAGDGACQRCWEWLRTKRRDA